MRARNKQDHPVSADMGKTQRQKFIDKARELGTDESPEAFERALTAIAKAPVPAAKKAAKTPHKKR